MSQAINIYFLNTPYSKLASELNEIARRIDHESWRYPEVGQPKLSIYYYDDLLNEFEDEQLDALLEKLGDFPESIVSLEYHASQGNKTCEHAVILAIRLLKLFPGVVDDLHGDFWTLAEITAKNQKAHGTFYSATHYWSLKD